MFTSGYERSFYRAPAGLACKWPVSHDLGSPEPRRPPTPSTERARVTGAPDWEAKGGSERAVDHRCTPDAVVAALPLAWRQHVRT
jgi:hypothetical protein